MSWFFNAFCVIIPNKLTKYIFSSSNFMIIFVLSQKFTKMSYMLTIIAFYIFCWGVSFMLYGWSISFGSTIIKRNGYFFIVLHLPFDDFNAYAPILHMSSSLISALPLVALSIFITSFWKISKFHNFFYASCLLSLLSI